MNSARASDAQADPDEFAKTAAIDFARQLFLLGKGSSGPIARRPSHGQPGPCRIQPALQRYRHSPRHDGGTIPQALDRLRSEAVALSADWGPKVSVFWTDRHFSLGRFPPLDRLDYLDHAVALVERERVRPARPTLEEIHHYLRGAPFANWADVRGASRRPKRSSRRITKRICGHSSIPRAFATAG